MSDASNRFVEKFPDGTCKMKTNPQDFHSFLFPRANRPFLIFMTFFDKKIISRLSLFVFPIEIDIIVCRRLLPRKHKKSFNYFLIIKKMNFSA